MEASPTSRLPAANSLPDGFVESPGEAALMPLTPSESDYKAPLLDVDEPVPPVISEGAPSPDAASETAEKLGTLCDLAESGIAPQEASVESRVDHLSRNPETEGCSELLSTNPVEGSKTQKPESSEVKRKVVKRNTKSEKELLELTFKYQKVIVERDAAITVKEKLESLCRELQRQNKLLMSECQRVAAEGQNFRQDISTKFSDAIKDVSNKLEQQKDECLSQFKENEMLRSKLKHLADQYAITEQQFEQKLKQKMLELQLADLKLQQHQERASHEQTQMQLYVEQVSQLLATEKTLRSQLAADGEKFQQFQDALLKSNEVFETFKQEMEKMGKLIKELKKENQFLKSKCERSDVAIVKLIEERELMKMQIEKVKNQKDKLESLCRTLQEERRNRSSIIFNSLTSIAQSEVSSVAESSEKSES
ncbi:alpha-taxilin [Dioscorea cayenensis subsp. rotundata]|uniref:Alpha-taxilin n=1 Tax=Dioscorea cayennensis subsp. rotundata TaxID=55577 RepID=A0AB40C0I1_DIOCR|nr:alpha-taxilin [Dioscorea cayenensis subsp. rotundata]